jgi:hypothetical protein
MHIKNLPCGVTPRFDTANTKKQWHFILSQFQPSLIFTSCTKTTVKIYRVSQAECTRLWENVLQFKLHQYKKTPISEEEKLQR